MLSLLMRRHCGTLLVYISLTLDPGTRHCKHRVTPVVRGFVNYKISTYLVM